MLSYSSWQIVIPCVQFIFSTKYLMSFPPLRQAQISGFVSWIQLSVALPNIKIMSDSHCYVEGRRLSFTTTFNASSSGVTHVTSTANKLGQRQNTVNKFDVTLHHSRMFLDTSDCSNFDIFEVLIPCSFQRFVAKKFSGLHDNENFTIQEPDNQNCTKIDARVINVPKTMFGIK